MAEVTEYTQRNPQAPTKEKPRLYNIKKMREDLEVFVEYHEDLSMLLNGNKGYMRELMENEEYMFNVYMCTRNMLRLKPKLTYYYDMFKARSLTPEQVEKLSTSTTDYLWMHKLKASELLMEIR